MVKKNRRYQYRALTDIGLNELANVTLRKTQRYVRVCMCVCIVVFIVY